MRRGAGAQRHLIDLATAARTPPPRPTFRGQVFGTVQLAAESYDLTEATWSCESAGRWDRLRGPMNRPPASTKHVSSVRLPVAATPLYTSSRCSRPWRRGGCPSSSGDQCSNDRLNGQRDAGRTEPNRTAARPARCACTASRVRLNVNLSNEKLLQSRMLYAVHFPLGPPLSFRFDVNILTGSGLRMVSHKLPDPFQSSALKPVALITSVHRCLTF